MKSTLELEPNELIMLSAKERRVLLFLVASFRKHVTVAQLATEFGVSKSAVYKDIKCLEDILPCEMVPGRNGGIFVHAEHRPFAGTLTEEECDILLSLKDINSDVERIVLNLVREFGPREYGRFHRVVSVSHVVSKDLQEGIIRRRLSERQIYALRKAIKDADARISFILQTIIQDFGYR